MAGMTTQPQVTTGLDRLVQQGFALCKGKRVALLAHVASVDSKLRHIVQLAQQHRVNVVRIFGPEHGFRGAAQDMQPVSSEHTAEIPIVSLYNDTEDSLRLDPQCLQDVDLLLCDVQDVGSRYYTFATTVGFALQACAQAQVPCVVLDRPNPVGGVVVEGNVVQRGFTSFVGAYPIANRHGLTLGELALLYNHLHKKSCALDVVWMHGWQRNHLFADTGLPWVLPSPNMPTPDTALVYPGGCLLEGTNLSEGRGTTRPFELVGAPYIDNPQGFVRHIESTGLVHGARLRPCWFTPTSHKHAHQLCGGIQIHITDPQGFRSLPLGIAIVWAARHCEGFQWRREAYEFVTDRLAIDLLFGDDEPRTLLEAGASAAETLRKLERSAPTSFVKLRGRALHPGYELQGA